MFRLKNMLSSLLTAALLTLAVSEMRAAEQMPTIVYINGAKYYIHTVAAGETLYSISRQYGTTVQTIVEYNPSVADGLKQDVTVKIPVASANGTSSADEESAAKKKRRDFEYHTVAAGETLYSIARRYEISVDKIREDNPDIDPAQLSVGTRLYIRKADIGSAQETQVRNEWENYRDNLNTVAPEGYEYYIVQAGDTLYSLCRRFEVTEAELRAKNDLADGLKAGGIILVPSQTKAAEQTSPNSETVQTDVPTHRNDLSGRFDAVDSRRALRAALLLPLTKNGATDNRYIDFYRGFLLGAERLKESGRSMDLTLYDTEQSAAKVRRIVEGGFDGAEPDIIFGPVYENAVGAVTEYADEHNIPLVTPLASMSSTDGRTLFQMSPDGSRKYAKFAGLFDGSREITLIYGNTTDREFEGEIMPLLAGRHYTKHKYVYQHPRAGGDNDLSALLRGGGQKLFVIMADNETEVDRILAALASADISLRSRTISSAQFVVLGNTRWNRYSNLDRSIFFRTRVVMPSSYAARHDNPQVAEFDRMYVEAFESMPSPYSYRGYDAAVIFGEGMFSAIDDDLQGRRYVPLQTGYTFEQVQGALRIANTEWMRMNYRDDFTITVE